MITAVLDFSIDIYLLQKASLVDDNPFATQSLEEWKKM